MSSQAEGLLSVHAGGALDAEARFVLTQDLLQGGAIFQGESLGLQLHPSRLNPPHGHGQVEDALHHATMADPQ